MANTYDAGVVTAYGAAVRGGYTGTYEEFCAQQAEYADNAAAVEQAVSDAEASATAAAASATAAATSESNAADSATAAATSETNAAASATAAATSEANAATSETNAAASETAAEAAQAAAEAVLASIPEDYTELSEDVDALKNAIDASLNTVNVNISSSTVTDIELNVGDSVDIYVKSVDGNVNCYIEGYTSTNVLLLTTNSIGVHNTYTAQHSGKLKFTLLTATLFEADIYINSEVRSLANATANSLTPIINSVYETVDVAVVLGSLNTASGAETTSTTAMRTDYLSGYVDIVSATNCKIRIYAYDKTGTFIGGRTSDGDWTTDYTEYKWFDSPFYISDLPTEYVYRVVFGRVVGDVTEENIQPKVTINKIKRGSTPIYEVGNEKQFATFTEMLTTLEDDDTEKIVYVYPGTYDIFDEIGGAEYMASVDTSLNWRNVSNIVPSNTTIIGIGDVILSWNPTDAQIIDQYHAFMFSPLNISGSCKIQNIKIHCSNCRYGIHDETSGKAIYNGAVHVFENVEVIYTASTYGVHYAYGAGHNKNCKYKYKNCLFSAAYGVSWSVHDWPAAVNEGTCFEFDNCVFKNNVSNIPAGVRFSSSDTVGRLDDVKINGCVFDSISFSTEGSTDVKQGYKVQTMLCKSYTVSYSSYILETDRIAPVDYLQIS